MLTQMVVSVRFIKAQEINEGGKAEWAHALAGGLSVCGAEGSVARQRQCA